MFEVWDDFKRLRVRGDDPARLGLAVRADDPPTFLGRVASAASKIAVGKYLIVNPVSVLGPEVEGGPGTLGVDAATAVPVYLLGPATPAPGDDLICRFVGHRWVADRPNSAATVPIGIGIPGCTCQGTPGTLALTVTFGPKEDAHTYGNVYQSCSLAYSTMPPPYMPKSAFPGAAYYSTTAWVDDSGLTDYFRLSCVASQYILSVGQDRGGDWQAPVQIYAWTMGGKPAVNFCSPFLLAVGRPQQGVAFGGKFAVSG